MLEGLHGSADGVGYDVVLVGRVAAQLATREVEDVADGVGCGSGAGRFRLSIDTP